MSVDLVTPQFDALMRQLNQLDDAIRKVALKEGLQSGADILAHKMGELAPRSMKSRTASSPSQRWRTGRHAADNIKRQGPTIRALDASMKVGWDTKANDPHFYMKFSEFGTSSMRARPFMEMANEQAGSEVNQAIADRIKEVMNGAG